VNNTITYEFPLNEKIRTFIRLEYLFEQFIHFSEGHSTADKRAAVSSLLDIIAVFKRTDLRSDVLKELNHQTSVFKKIASHEGVNEEKLQEVLDQINQITKRLYDINGRVGSHLEENELLQSITQRSSIPGGTYSFDLPEYHYWLTQDESIQAKDLQIWSQPFIEVHNALIVILNFIRTSRPPRQEIAEAGFFQVSLDKTHPFQLIKVTLDDSTGCFAEISGGKHRCNIRFMEPASDNKRARQSANDIPFTLTRCFF
jgi:cell division protein ZapD